MADPKPNTLVVMGESQQSYLEAQPVVKEKQLLQAARLATDAELEQLANACRRAGQEDASAWPGDMAVYASVITMITPAAIREMATRQSGWVVLAVLEASSQKKKRKKSTPSTDAVHLLFDWGWVIVKNIRVLKAAPWVCKPIKTKKKKHRMGPSQPPPPSPRRPLPVPPSSQDAGAALAAEPAEVIPPPSSPPCLSVRADWCPPADPRGASAPSLDEWDMVVKKRKPQKKKKNTQKDKQDWSHVYSQLYVQGPKWADVREYVEDHDVCCITGATGSGKSTTVPQMLVATSATARVIVAVPTRSAAKRLANTVDRAATEDKHSSFLPRATFRIGGERGFGNSSSVVDGPGKMNEATWTKAEERLTYCTHGYLLTLVTHQPWQWAHFSHVVLDEVHERSLDVELLLLHLTQWLASVGSAQQGTLEPPRVVLMSATMAAAPLLEHFDSSCRGGLRVACEAHDIGLARCKTEVVWLEDDRLDDAVAAADEDAKRGLKALRKTSALGSPPRLTRNALKVGLGSPCPPRPLAVVC